MLYRSALLAVAAACLVACGSDSGPSSNSSATGGTAGSGGSAGSGAVGGGGGTSNLCPANQERVNGECVDPCAASEDRAADGSCISAVDRYQPAERVDFDNVMFFGEEELQELELPEPPKSGFRIIAPPRTLMPGDEDIICVSWPYPQLTNEYVYAARLYTTGGLHHSNVYGMTHHSSGPSDYPKCAPGQSDPFSKFSQLTQGIIPDVLFANSTQIIGQESIVFPPGMAYKVHTEGREIATNLHYLNASAEPIRFELAYDFYTMPKDELVEELAPYYFDNFGFEVPPQSEMDVSTTCNLHGGNIVTMMQHSHERTRRFTVDLLDVFGGEEQIYETVGYDSETDIRIFDEPISLENQAAIRHTCHIENDLDEPIDYGIGTDEMCTLFGYLYPRENAAVGIVQEGSTGCLSVRIEPQE